jgi:hypothetical protein
MTDKQKAWIDNATYRQMLSLWRFASLGNPMFRGDTAEYYAKVMDEKRPSDAEHSQVSKDLGWEG